MKNFLRLLAVLQLLTSGIAFLPNDSIAWWHARLGLGQMPHDALLQYALRGGGLVQGAIGVLLWVMSMDVARFRPLIITVAVIFLISAPAFFLLDTIVGMPRFWCLLDGTSCFIVGGILSAFCLASPPHKSQAT